MSITFDEKLLKLGSRFVIKIPLNISKNLPSRGMAMVKVTINEIDFIVPLEPDGEGSHWLEVLPSLVIKIGLEIGKTVSLKIEPMDEWIEPDVPEDIMDAIISSDLLNAWNSITIKAKWDWIRWIRSTSNPDTRKKRINVACSKLLNGDTRPCCFDRTRCTITDISKSGVLLE